jgi:hypothetical protein
MAVRLFFFVRVLQVRQLGVRQVGLNLTGGKAMGRFGARLNRFSTMQKRIVDVTSVAASPRGMNVQCTAGPGCLFGNARAMKSPRAFSVSPCIR